MTEPIADQVISSFRDFYTRSTKHKKGRLARLLLHTVPVRCFPQNQLEELFFFGLVGDVKIESVIPYILQMETVSSKDELGKDLFWIKEN